MLWPVWPWCQYPDWFQLTSRESDRRLLKHVIPLFRHNRKASLASVCYLRVLSMLATASQSPTEQLGDTQPPHGSGVLGPTSGKCRLVSLDGTRRAYGRSE